MSIQQVLIAGQWRDADRTGTFYADNPATKEALPGEFPVSAWSDCEAALQAASEAATGLRTMTGEQVASFLDDFANRIEQHAGELVEMAHAETALPKAPRLADVELPRTTNQLRLGAAAARNGSWAQATIDTTAGIRSCYGPIGPICVFGPNNFPFAFGSVSGGDFAAAIAAGNPVIAKANSSHPGTTRIFAEAAHEASLATNMPAAIVQLLYRTSHVDGERLVADPRTGATGYTGSRNAGLKLKQAADAVGKPIYLELSSTNPVVILPGALEERLEAIADDFSSSCLMGAGQFCTNPGIVVLIAGERTERFITEVAQRFEKAAVGTLLSKSVEMNLQSNLSALRTAGAELVVGDSAGQGAGYCRANTLLRTSGATFLASAEALQTEAFGNASLFVVAAGIDEVAQLLGQMEGNLTGCVYSHTGGQDDADYELVAGPLRQRVGRLLNDKMPTGVAVSSAMNHGGPYPCTGHPGFTAVGMPASLVRFAMLQSYDNVRAARLPQLLQDKNSTDATWRLVDGQWTTGDVDN
ncbi:MAG: aldehyde dehydrogenase (NADP(+)) [Pirellulaceae bacterium]|jgi:NADP-dependent aldehyde dehydrogenase|nr:ketoglutarate semialdehyde dehydrogenase [Planctomycetaceae bacterium]MDP6469142.1 aldehyde dehydrogenase (NADP(+)) [Pirellulaceae bacterium]MDP6554811.1 aldehyde dehydrogenase (NADP(+)) [Pirellulaceae bacterium]MDP6722827.1 aldehyde dehydrogenase (NADP(+)) [Pirellulaceae bacterium]